MKSTQYHVLLIIVYPFFLAFLLIIIFNIAYHEPIMGIILSIAAIFILIIILLYYKLTISINSEFVAFSFGIGRIKKKYKISQIKKCKPFKGKFSIYSRMTFEKLPDGGKAYVLSSSFPSIEITYENENGIIRTDRIGANKPDEISNIVNALISKSQIPDFKVTKPKKWKKILEIILACFVLVILLLTIIPALTDTKVELKKDEIKIKGIYGLTIPYTEILQVDTNFIYSPISMRTNGYALGRTLIGNFRLENNTNVKMFIKRGFRPVILIQSKNNKPIYINFQERNKTINLYNELKNRCPKCSGTDNSNSETFNQFGNKIIKLRANRILRLFQEKKFSIIYENCNDELKQKLSIEKLSDIWIQLNNKYGNYIENNEFTLEFLPKVGFKSSTVCRFEKGNVNFILIDDIRKYQSIIFEEN